MPQLLPKELLDLQIQIDEIQRKLNRAVVVSVPNQNLSQTSDVEFNSILVSTRGVWTPTFSGSTAAGVFTYTAQIGYYLELSNVIFLFARLAISAIGTPPTGVMRIAGLPFGSNAVNYGAISFGRIHHFNYTAAALQLTGYISPSTQLIQLAEVFDNGASVTAPAANFTNVLCDVIFTGSYQGA